MVQIDGVDKLIRRLEGMQEQLKMKADSRVGQFATKLALLGYTVADDGFKFALYPGNNDVRVQFPYWKGDTLYLTASGSTVLFIEFGSGVTWSPGTNPLASKVPGVAPGAYSASHAGFLNTRDWWIYKGDPGTGFSSPAHGRRAGAYWTKGNPPANAMYDASKQMRMQMLSVAKEVFGK